MYKQMVITLTGLVLLLFSACGQVETLSTHEPVVTQNPVEATPVSVYGLAPEKYSEYIGMSYPPRPDGLFEEMGMLVQGSEDHSLSLVSEGENKMLWLSQLTHRDANGNAYWVVKDILDLSEVEAGMNLILDGCSLNGVWDNEIFVMGKDGAISMAWRANTTLNLFEVIPATGIECQSDKVVNF